MIKENKKTSKQCHDMAQYRADFPIFNKLVHGKPLCFLDSGASTQKPVQVMDAMNFSMENNYANIHRGLYQFSQDSTSHYEKARGIVKDFINAQNEKEIIFTYNTTSAINLVAHSYVMDRLVAGDEIILSVMEHHANLVPWHIVAQKKGVKLVYCQIDKDGNFEIENFKACLSPRTKFVAMTHISNVLGTITPIKEIAELTHDNGAKILVDGSQAVQHQSLDMQELDVDFYCFTGHKLYGPTGIGVLYGKEGLLDAMPPFLTGGDMIETVSFDEVRFAPLPAKFEAGTPPILEAFGLKAAIEYVKNIGFEKIHSHEMRLHDRLMAELSKINGLTIHGKAEKKGPIIAFSIKGQHPQDLATLLDQQGVAVRTGHHCAMPLHEILGVSGSIRASIGLYNHDDDIDQFLLALDKSMKILN